MDTSGEFEVYGSLRTDLYTPPTLDTLLRGKGDLQSRILRLGVLTEDTPQGTSLEKHHAADTGAVFETVPLDVNDKGKGIHRHNDHPTPSLRARSLTINPNL